MMQIVCNGKEKAFLFNSLNTLLTSKRIHTSVSFCSKICFIECMAASTPLVSHLSFGVTQQLFVFPNDVSDNLSNTNWANLRILLSGINLRELELLTFLDIEFQLLQLLLGLATVSVVPCFLFYIFQYMMIFSIYCSTTRCEDPPASFFI